jgi:hypothetical protein
MGLCAGLLVFVSAALAVVSRIGEPHVGAALVPMALAAGGAGLALGFAQALVFGKLGPLVPWRLLVATDAAFALAWIVGALVAQRVPLGGVSRTLLAGTLLGLLVGVAQALVLPKPFRGSGRWIAGSALAWTVGMGAVIAGFDAPGGLIAPILGLAIGILAIGAIGGAVVVRMERDAYPDWRQA